MRLRLLGILSAFLIVFWSSSASAAGLVPYLTYSGTSTTTTLPTDGDVNTYATVENGLEYTFPSPTTLTSVSVDFYATCNACSISVLFYDAGNTVVAGSAENFPVGRATKNFVVNKQVNKLRITTEAPSFRIYEIGVVDNSPKNVTIAAGSPTANEIPLGFTATNADTIEIYREDIKVDSVAGTTTNYVDKGRSPDTTYKYYIKAVNAYGTTASNIITVKTLSGPPPPPPPSNVTISAGTPKSEEVPLTFSATNADSIDLYRNDIKIKSFTGTATSFLDSGLQADTLYKYYIKAVNPSGPTASNIITVRTAKGPPPGITSVSVSTTKTQVKVSWVGGVGPYTVTWGSEKRETPDTSVLLGGFSPGTVVTITVTDSNGSSKTVTVKTPESGDLEDPLLPSETGVYQRMVNLFGTAGTYALVVIGGAVALGIIVILAMYTWRLLKRWLSSAK